MWLITEHTRVYIWHFTTVASYWPVKRSIYLIYFVILYNILTQQGSQCALLVQENCECYKEEASVHFQAVFITLTLNFEASVFLKFCLIKINTLIVFWEILPPRKPHSMVDRWVVYWVMLKVSCLKQCCLHLDNIVSAPYLSQHNSKMSNYQSAINLWPVYI